MIDPDRVPRLVPRFVAVLLLTMVVSAVFVLEPWPFTSFRLFSHLRHDQQVTWQLDAVGTGGEARRWGHPRLPFTMRRFESAGAGERNAICRDWLQAAASADGAGAEEVLVYRHEWLLSEREGDRAAPGIRTLVYRCDRSGVDGPLAEALR